MRTRRPPLPRVPDDDALAERSPGYRIGRLLRNLNHALRQDFDAALRRSGVPLSLPQLTVLFTVRCEPALLGASVARSLGITPQTASQLLARLERGGYITRCASRTHARADCWSVTTRGAAVLARAMQSGEPVFERMTASLTARQVDQLAALLGRCVASLAGGVAVTPAAAAPGPRRRAGRG